MTENAVPDEVANRSDFAKGLLDELHEADMRLSGLSGPLTVGLMAGVITLWRDVVASGSVRFNIDPATESAQPPCLLDRVDHGVISLPVRMLSGADFTDEDYCISTAHNVLLTLNNILSSQLMSTGADRVVVYSSTGGQINLVDVVPLWQLRARTLTEQVQVVMTLRDSRARAEELTNATAVARKALADAGEELKERVAELETARAQKANNDLATHFRTLADDETRLSWIFRLVAGLLIVVAGAFGIWGVSNSDNLRDAIGHATVVLTIAGASAYAIRLASLHRLTGDWAHSIDVQLQTFEAFLATVENKEIRDHVYQEFGRRVLGSPPRSEGKEDASVVPLSQVMEIAATLAKRN